jgi:hypothetical protein
MKSEVDTYMHLGDQRGPHGLTRYTSFETHILLADSRPKDAPAPRMPRG